MTDVTGTKKCPVGHLVPICGDGSGFCRPWVVRAFRLGFCAMGLHMHSPFDSRRGEASDVQIEKDTSRPSARALKMDHSLAQVGLR